MKFNWDNIWLGTILGLAAPAICMVCYWKFEYGYMDMDKFIGFLVLGKIYIKLISLFVVTNLAVFFVFIWKQCNYSARGVLLATFIYTLAVAVLKIFVLF